MTTYRNFLLVLALLTAVGMQAQTTAGLVKQGWYADPEIHYFQHQYWVYPTSSDDTPRPEHPGDFTPAQQARRAEPGARKVYLPQTYLDAFSSPNLVHWTRHPHVLDVKNVSWAAYAVWAPTITEANGRYYLIFSANDIQKNDHAPGGLGLAVSDSPAGPFKDALGHPLIGEFHNGAQPIDPMIYRDDDGRLYLYYGGQGHCNVTGLAPDLTHTVPLPDGTLSKEITPAEYVEGPFMLKRNGTYYFMWSEGDWETSTYGVAYARSNSPTGPFIRAGKILQADAKVANGPGHHSVLRIPGTDDYLIAYHRHPLNNKEPNQRELAIDRLSFDSEGNIRPVQMTPNGLVRK